jgi:hypothetical protein
MSIIDDGHAEGFTNCYRLYANLRDWIPWYYARAREAQTRDGSSRRHARLFASN